MNYSNSPSSFDVGPFILLAFVPFIIIVLQIILFFKIWFACNDIRDIRKANNKVLDLNQDLQYWARAKYESDKRTGVITEADLEKAETYLNGSSEK